MTFVILTGGLDLSVASAAGFAGMILGLCYQGRHEPGCLRSSSACVSGILSGVLSTAS